MRSYVVGDFDRREVGPGIGNNLLSIHELSEIIDTFRHSVIRTRWMRVCSFLLLCGHLVLSNRFFVIEVHRVVHVWSNSLV